jgi:hypothetical protein
MSPLFLFFTKYNLGFHLKTLISKFSRDETLTLVFKMLQEAPRNPSNSKTREIKYKGKSKRGRKTRSVHLVTSLTHVNLQGDVIHKQDSKYKGAP